MARSGVIGTEKGRLKLSVEDSGKGKGEGGRKGEEGVWKEGVVV